MDPSLAFPGKTPDYNDRGLEPAIWALTVPLTVLSLAALVIRCYARARYNRQFNPEDVFAIASWSLAFTFALYLINSLGIGVGRHIWNVPPGGVWKKRLFENVAVNVPPACHTAGMTFVKLSILLLFLRIFPSRSMKVAIYVVLVFVGLSGAILTILTIAPCTPFRASYDFRDEVQNDPNAKCINRELLYTSGSIIMAVGDVMILLLPIRTILKSALPKTQKIHVMAVFLVGSIATASSILRAYCMFDGHRGWRAADFTYSFGQMNLAAVVELYLSIICACAPGLKVFLGRNFKIFATPRPAASDSASLPRFNVGPKGSTFWSRIKKRPSRSDEGYQMDCSSERKLRDHSTSEETVDAVECYPAKG